MDLTARHALLHAAVTHAADLRRFLSGQVSDANEAQDLMQELYLAIAASIDTPLHGLFDPVHVDHMHPDAVIAIAAARRKSEYILRGIEGINWWT